MNLINKYIIPIKAKITIKFSILVICSLVIISNSSKINGIDVANITNNISLNVIPWLGVVSSLSVMIYQYCFDGLGGIRTHYPNFPVGWSWDGVNQ